MHAHCETQANTFSINLSDLLEAFRILLGGSKYFHQEFERMVALGGVTTRLQNEAKVIINNNKAMQ